MLASGNVGRFQFTGRAWLPEAGLYYFKARFYSASLGRFLQTDPIGYGGGMNLYAYVKGDPVNFTDPMGLDRNKPFEGIGGEIIAHVVSLARRINDDFGSPFVFSPGSGNAALFELSTPETVEPQTQKPGKCFNGDVGVSVTAQAILGVGGGSSVGVSYGGRLLDSRLFLKFQANGMYGVGAFAGVGVSGSGGPDAVSAGLSSTYGFHMEANRGAAVAWSAGYDYSGPGGVSAGGAHERIPFGRLGAGAGYSFGAGAFTQSTYGFPSIGDMWSAAAEFLTPLVDLPTNQSAPCAN